MNKKLFLVVIVLLVISGIGLGKSYSNSVTLLSPSASFNPISIPTSSPSTEVKYYPPKILTITKLGIQSNVESVGLDSQGRMDVPKRVENVGWFNLGFKIGDKGSVVLAGHFDDVSGAPAVFYNLNQLQVGDEVEILDELGKVWKYSVEKKEIYDYDKVPLEEVFAYKDKHRLNLITCDGVFNQNAKNYSKRLIVYTELID